MPIIKIGIFSKNIKTPDEIPVRYCIISAIPPTPPLIRLWGVINILIAKAPIILPKRIFIHFSIMFLRVLIIIPPFL